MQIIHVFSGSALSGVDEAGYVGLPRFVRSTVERRGDSRHIVLGVHGRDPCLTGYDPAYGPILHAEFERRRLLDEAAGGDGDDLDDRARGVFGLTEQAAFDEDGRVVLPPMMRECGSIADLALFVGTGGSFEIWNPDLASRAGGPRLRRLAEIRLRQERNANSKEEESR